MSQPKPDQRIALEEVSPTIEVPEEVDKSLDEYRGVGHDELLEVLPSMEDNYQHDTIILHDFEDHFLHNKFVPDHDIQHFFLDWNSRTSSFEEGETDVGRQSQRPS